MSACGAACATTPEVVGYLLIGTDNSAAAKLLKYAPALESSNKELDGLDGALRIPIYDRDATISVTIPG
jgi:hypothetical protein